MGGCAQGLPCKGRECARLRAAAGRFAPRLSTSSPIEHDAWHCALRAHAAVRAACATFRAGRCSRARGTGPLARASAPRRSMQSERHLGHVLGVLTDGRLLLHKALPRPARPRARRQLRRRARTLHRASTHYAAVISIWQKRPRAACRRAAKLAIGCRAHARTERRTESSPAAPATRPGCRESVTLSAVPVGAALSPCARKASLAML